MVCFVFFKQCNETSKICFLGYKMMVIFVKNHLLEKLEVEVTAWSAGVLESLIQLLVERNVTLGFCSLSYTGFKST